MHSLTDLHIYIHTYTQSMRYTVFSFHQALYNSAFFVLLFILVAYLLGLPIFGYSLDIGKEHVNLIDERLEKLLYSGQLDTKELDRYLPGSFSQENADMM